MSNEDFSKKMEQTKRQINLLRKDINNRDEQDKRGKPTYEADSEIRGQFIQINESLQNLSGLLNTLKNNLKQFGVSNAEYNKRTRKYEELINEKNNLQKVYDGFLSQKKPQKNSSLLSEDHKRFDDKHDTKNMSQKDLLALKAKQEEQQDQAIDNITNTVRNIKNGGKTIEKQLDEQKDLLGVLEDKMDDNIDDMTTTRRAMHKLLSSSSNCCLITIMLIEIALIVVLWIVW